jgi:hypothetical protein
MADTKWSIEKANSWLARHPWLAGCNFIPSTAINQLEMWQVDTFDPATIERELGWAANLGFNSLRVSLHDLLWQQDKSGFKDRIQRYLDMANRHKLKTMFVLFDDCWHDDPRPGRQPEPIPGVHNSGWVRSPGTQAIRDEKGWGRLEEYVRGVIGAFGNDERVLMWDVYNEPGNNFLVSLRLPRSVQVVKIVSQLFHQFALPIPSQKLLRTAFTWARHAHPTQPLTSATWYLSKRLGGRLNKTVLELSDVITFHCYFDLETTTRIVAKLQSLGRPVICTEYLARAAGSNFKSHLPYFKAQKVGCYNWGLVSGKTQTMYSWQDNYPAGEAPPLWFHDILRRDGTPYDAGEVEFIRKITAFQRDYPAGHK